MPAITYNCTMQEGQIGPDVRERLAEGLRRVSVDILGPAAADAPVRFSDIPEGFGFRGGEPSHTSLVRGTAADPLEQPVRERLLNAIQDMWLATAGCTTDDLVATVRDP